LWYEEISQNRAISFIPLRPTMESSRRGRWFHCDALKESESIWPYEWDGW